MAHVYRAARQRRFRVAAQADQPRGAVHFPPEDAMSDTSDPRTRGFNYGVGWGSDPKPPVFLTAAKLARDLGKRAAELNREAWALEMASSW